MNDGKPLSLPFLENLAPQAKRERPRARAALPARYATARVARELELEDDWAAAPGASATPAPRAADAATPARAFTTAATTPERPANRSVNAAPPTRPAPRREPAAPSQRVPFTVAEPPESTPSPRVEPAATPLPPNPAPLRPVLSPSRPVEAAPVVRQTFELELPAPISEPLRPEAIASRNAGSPSDAPTVVHVTIDRIDLRADPPAAAAPKRTRAETKSSLGDYLKQRDAARRGRPVS